LGAAHSPSNNAGLTHALLAVLRVALGVAVQPSVLPHHHQPGVSTFYQLDTLIAVRVMKTASDMVISYHESVACSSVAGWERGAHEQQPGTISYLVVEVGAAPHPRAVAARLLIHQELWAGGQAQQMEELICCLPHCAGQQPEKQTWSYLQDVLPSCVLTLACGCGTTWRHKRTV